MDTRGRETPAQRRMRNLAEFASATDGVADGLIRDFYTHHLWDDTKCLPISWKIPLEHVNMTTLANMLTKPLVAPEENKPIWPLSLLAFVAACHAMRLRGNTGADSARRASESLPLNSPLRQQLNPKKEHEVVRLSELVSAVGRASSCDACVDIGSGKGYLSRALAFAHSWDVVGLEAVESNVERAEVLDAKTVKVLRKKDASLDLGRVRHVAALLPPDVSTGDFRRLLRSGGGGTAAATAASGLCVECEPPQRGALVGLHACGDLSCTMLRAFDSAGDAVGCVVSLGCCYMRLSTGGEADEPGCVVARDSVQGAGSGEEGAAAEDAQWEQRFRPVPRGMGQSTVAAEGAARRTARVPGFPMSAYAAATGLELDYFKLEMACHKLDAYAKRLLAAAEDDEEGNAKLELHCRRALVEVMLRRRSGRTEPPTCGTYTRALRNGHRLTWREYVAAIYERRGLEPDADDWEQAAQLEPQLAGWRRVVSFFVLRNLLSAVWEAAILIDRLLYLGERGHAAALVPLFDPDVSPRNMALVALRRGAEGTPSMGETEWRALLPAEPALVCDASLQRLCTTNG